MKRLLAMLMCVVLAAPACASTRGARLQAAPTVPNRAEDAHVLAEFVNRMPIGSHVNATVIGNKRIRGTLVKRTEQTLTLQPRTRVPEPLVEIRYEDLLAIEQEAKSGPPLKSIAVGVAVGVGAALGTLFILAALLSD